MIGRLSGVCADSIRFAFELLSAGTALEEARLEIDQPPAVCRCGACGTQTELEDLSAVCPKCGSADVRIEGGQDLLLQSIELEEPGEGQ